MNISTPLYIRTYKGTAVRITAIFPADKEDEANAYMEEHPDESLITANKHVILLARTDDQGVTLEKMLECPT